MSDIVQCDTCRRFTPNVHTPSHGVGECALNAWLDSRSPVMFRGTYAPPPPYAQADRICKKWRAR